MIFVLRDTANYNDTYYIEKFETKEEAIESIQEVGGYIKDFIFIEGQKLKLTLRKDNEQLRTKLNNSIEEK